MKWFAVLFAFLAGNEIAFHRWWMAAINVALAVCITGFDLTTARAVHNLSSDIGG